MPEAWAKAAEAEITALRADLNLLAQATRGACKLHACVLPRDIA